MTKPAPPPPARADVVELELEIEAMDVAEWESGQRTPQAADANLAELVRKTATQPAPPTRVQTVARERARAQIGAPAIPRPPSRARTEPPGPPPKSTRARTPRAGTPVASARANRVPDIPAGRGVGPGAGPGIEPRRSPALTPVGGVDFSLPVTATSPGMPAASEPRRPPTQTPVSGVDFSLPVTATSPGMAAAPEPRRSPAQTPVGGADFSPPVTATSPRKPAEPVAMRPLPMPPGPTGFSMPAVETSPRPPSEPPRPRAAMGSDSELSRTATATSESGARPPELEPLPPTPGASPFAEASRVGPGHNASPPGGAEPNTAWPPRPIPVDASPQFASQLRSPLPLRPPSQPPRLAAPEPSIHRARRPGGDDAGGADRVNVALSRRRLWWIGGGLASASLSAILLAVLLPNPDALAPDASDAARTAGSAPGPRRDSPAPPVDRAAADLRDRVRIARNAAAVAAAAAANAPAVVERRPTQSAREADPAVRSPADEAAALRSMAKKSGAHRVVVDYSSRPSDPAPPSLVSQGEEDAAIGQARTAYSTGNQRLFVGDLDGAIRAYHQALELYPGYVGGYRGLGLAYEQRGDAAIALEALRAYVAAAPNARDVALIKKRIAHLQRR
jgi:tetratricopeptide repeat protein